MPILSPGGGVSPGILYSIQTVELALRRLSPIALFVAAILFPSAAIAQQRGTASPHGEISASVACLDCHTDKAWKPLKKSIQFNHTNETGFALLGSHLQVACTACHTSLVFDAIASTSNADCADCHNDVHAGELSSTCASCHNEISFLDIDAQAIHDATIFPLVGAHAQITCDGCHRSNTQTFQTGADTSCESCHLEDFNSAVTIDHVDAGFPMQCEDCHNQFVWNGVVFDHVQTSGGFDLVGAHEGLACSSCHTPSSPSSIFGSVAQNECIACHESDFEDEHGGNFPTTCLDCHSIDSWDDADFEHGSVANGFELLGAHEPLSCESCHTTPGFDLLFQVTDQDDCVACHQSDYDSEHAGSGFPTTCETCHNNTLWDDAEFDHMTASNGFELLGAHAPLSCENCHIQPGLEPIFAAADQNDCIACHQSDYDSEHAGSGFPTTCNDCHNNQNWDDAEFDHVTASAGFDLVGAHEPLACESCHQMPGLELLFTPADQNDCVACHQADYDNEHGGSGFSTTCTNCHGTDSWDDADFDHTSASAGFELLGAHEPLSCENCHNLPGLELLFSPANQNDCIACHQADYDSEHGGSGFPTTCATCHSDDTWDGAALDHDGAFFPIYSGKHREEWTECQDCHPEPSAFQVFTCMTCHEHRQSEMDDKHSEVNGYSYLSTLCLSCHPDGNN
ncbi:MAG: hypothetical protein HKN43_02310 [Rhodothermales bacterium]|nr:hypothetical protein [Rhodothermales bacterium]